MDIRNIKESNSVIFCPVKQIFITTNIEGNKYTQVIHGVKL